MDFLSGKILGFVLITARVGGFFATSPVFSWETIPVNLKIAMIFLITIFFAGINPLPIIAEEPNILESIILIGSEFVYGLALGLVAMLLFHCIKLCARIIERQMGLTIASVMDPLTGEQASPIGTLMEIIFILLFLNIDGHHLLLMIISKSYEVYPVAVIPDIGQLLESIISAGSIMLLLALKLSSPILAAFLLMMVILAVMARIAPEMNILFVSMPMRVGLGMLMVAIFIPFILGFAKKLDILFNNLLPL